ncbi:oxidoreductase domain-containing protein [Alicyclobacillus hesperidum URH17-3-68]|uniref:Predicted dehydrogenase n=1 Tax=Alicyclobacillus hesperidum TaxID=89784 RepID=A0A1H2XKS5_9BACL|nr:Gfo/Idh/MocA family oxidoreductase [Alicyclobacillus hesperidum]EJY56099.1 oxidoreductase domain-containing protein [Alicyclobacillus hesperidum URH17-3-68]SDW93298.1 Predicted dehydrogenase [Alicyclobacillus hesperidum]
MAQVKVGVIGCGVISEIYLKNCQTFGMDVVACADIDLERARSRAAQFGVPKACSVDELLSDPEVEIVINLTIPNAHADIARRALLAGKHVHSEKPLALNTEEGKALVQLAISRGLRIGAAPDTFLGSHLQTARKVLDDGWIGRPIAATAFMMSHGPERWHPNPDFFYQPGGGPMFDMGPYYLTALVHLLGPVRQLTGIAQTTFAERVITGPNRFGERIPVSTPTHVTGLLQFEQGAVGTIVTSFDVWHSELPRIEIYGTEGTLSVPDPNYFGGALRVRRQGAEEWTEVAPLFGFSENRRGLAVADMADAVKTGRPHRANGELALHVLEIMEGIHVSSTSGRHYEMTTRCERPMPWPVGFDEDGVRLSFFH